MRPSAVIYSTPSRSFALLALFALHSSQFRSNRVDGSSSLSPHSRRLANFSAELQAETARQQQYHRRIHADTAAEEADASFNYSSSSLVGCCGNGNLNITSISTLSTAISKNLTHQRDEAASLCAGSLAAASSFRSSQEATASAMVGLVRLILVILICVLLVKMRAPKRLNDGDRMASGKRSSSKGNGDGDDESQCNECSDCVSSVQSADTKPKSFDSRNLINLTATYFTSRARRNSQPDLLSAAQSAPVGATSCRERRRRHSDTCLAHLKLPPGPMGLPFLGYLPFVGHEIHLTLTSLSERYGPIYQIFLGGIRVVVLNDASLVRQAFKQPVFSGRPDTQLTRILQGYGIVNSDGALWKEQRAFLHSALRKLGAKSLMSGSNGLEAKIQVSWLPDWAAKRGRLALVKAERGSRLIPIHLAAADEEQEEASEVVRSRSRRREFRLNGGLLTYISVTLPTNLLT